jgi:putative ABC transport system permease protein
LEPIRLRQVSAITGVERVVPIYEDSVGMKSPEDKRVRRIMVFAVPPDDLPLVLGNPSDVSRDLRLPHGMLFDRLSRPIFGQISTGQAVELDRVPQDVTGYAEIGPDIINDGAVVMSEGDWLSRDAQAKPIMGAIILKLGANLEHTRSEIIAGLPDDISVLTPAELRWREYGFTLRAAPIGFMFAVGVIAGLVIGTITCYQLLYNEVLDRLKQFATLKAMGFNDGFLRAAIWGQAMLIWILGFAAGLAFAAAADRYLAFRTALPIALGVNSTAIVLLLTLLMCVAAGTLAIQRVAAADPASLY